MINELLSEGNITFPCLISKAEIGRTNKNTPYLTFSLQDASGILDARYWNLTEEEAKAWHEGMVVEVSGELKRYRNAWQLRVFSIKQIDDSPIDYVPNAPVERSAMREEIEGLVERMENPIIHDICADLLEERGELYYTYPAAVRNHHNYPGGLAWHTLSMARLALDVLSHYDWLDYDLLIAGVLLHDLAKTEEFSAPLLPEYTREGNLIGHISMGAEMIDRAALRQNSQNSEEVTLLKHMVLSHHGKHEFGSPVLPMTAEAEVLSLLDNLDSRLVMIEKTIEQIAPGTFGPRNFALDNRMFYRKSWDDEGNRRIERTVETPDEARQTESQPSSQSVKENPQPNEPADGQVQPAEKENRSTLQSADPASAPQKSSRPEQTKRTQSARSGSEHSGRGSRHDGRNEHRPHNERRGSKESSEKNSSKSADGERVWTF